MVDLVTGVRAAYPVSTCHVWTWFNVGRNTKTSVTYSVNTETTCDGISEDWSDPVNFQISKLIKLGGQRGRRSALLGRIVGQRPRGLGLPQFGAGAGRSDVVHIHG